MTKLKYILITVLTLILIAVAMVVSYDLAFKSLIYPRIIVAGLEVTGMDKEFALRLISAYFADKPSSISLMYEGEEISTLSGLKVEHDPAWAVEQAIGVGRNGNVLTRVAEQVRALFYEVSIDVPVKLDRDELDDTIGQVAEKIGHKPVWPKLTIEGGKIKVVKGKKGVEVKKDDLMAEIMAEISLPGHHEISIPTITMDTSENNELVDRAVKA